MFGEITSHAEVDYAAIARQACRDIGYTHEELGFNADTAEVKVLVEQQVPEIAQVRAAASYTRCPLVLCFTL